MEQNLADSLSPHTADRSMAPAAGSSLRASKAKTKLRPSIKCDLRIDFPGYGGAQYVRFCLGTSRRFFPCTSMYFWFLPLCVECGIRSRNSTSASAARGPLVRILFVVRVAFNYFPLTYRENLPPIVHFFPVLFSKGSVAVLCEPCPHCLINLHHQQDLINLSQCSPSLLMYPYSPFALLLALFVLFLTLHYQPTFRAYKDYSCVGGGTDHQR